MQVLDKIQDLFFEVTNLSQGHMDGTKSVCTPYGVFENNERLSVSRNGQTNSAAIKRPESCHGTHKKFSMF